MNWFKRRSTPAPAPERERAAHIKPEAVASITAKPSRLQLTPIMAAPVIDEPFRPAEPPAGVPASAAMTMDDGLGQQFGGAYDTHEGVGFFGFPFLAEMAQRPEYRHMGETLAKEMTREWVRFTYQGEEDKTDKIKAIDAEFRRLKAQDAFRRAMELDGFFGRGQIYIDTGHTDKPGELSTPLLIDKRKLRKGAIKRLVVVEPMWSYPADYNSTDPLKPHYYRPQSWYVMAKKVHASRLLTLISREVPDILKPAYAFSGLSLSQMAKPYVDNWLRTRQSVSDLLHSFTVWVLKTDMSAFLSGEEISQLDLRVETFNRFRDNRGIFVLNKGQGEGDLGEEFENVSVPLGGLHELQAQAQEQMSSVSSIPLVKLLGVTPSGLNASSDGEIRVFYDYIAALQEQVFETPLNRLLRLVQLSLFGEIDDDIGFEFNPLWQQDEGAQAVARKADADIDCGYIDRGALSPMEVRRKLAADKTGPYAGIDVEDLPEAPDEGGEEMGEGDPERDMPSGGASEAE